MTETLDTTAGEDGLGQQQLAEQLLAQAKEQGVDLVPRLQRIQRRVAGELAAEMSDAVVTVVSGGAYGIDAAATSWCARGVSPDDRGLGQRVDIGYPTGNSAVFEHP